MLIQASMQCVCFVCVCVCVCVCVLCVCVFCVCVLRVCFVCVFCVYVCFVCLCMCVCVGMCGCVCIDTCTYIRMWQRAHPHVWTPTCSTCSTRAHNSIISDLFETYSPLFIRSKEFNVHPVVGHTHVYVCTVHSMYSIWWKFCSFFFFLCVF